MYPTRDPLTQDGSNPHRSLRGGEWEGESGREERERMGRVERERVGRGKRERDGGRIYNIERLHNIVHFYKNEWVIKNRL